MSENKREAGDSEDQARSPNGLVIIIAAFSVLAVVLFVSAGRLDWPAAWLWLGLVLLATIPVTAHIRKHNPGLAERRRRVGVGTASWDLVLVALLRLSFVAILIVSGLDRGRYGWSSLGVAGSIAGAVLLLMALAGIGWSMGANPHFETTVRIQQELGHRVIERGPYRFVRHPGYLHLALLWTGTALMLGSVWALVPATIGVLVLVFRTALEDRFLKSRLDGYRDYAERVRFRLVPLVW